MCDLQPLSYLLSLLVYPVTNLKRYHVRIIESKPVCQGTSTEPQLGLVLALQLLIFVSAAYAVPSQPVVDLTTGFNTYDIHFGEKSFQLAFQENGIVMSHSSLVRRHQLMSISRVLDFTDIAMANSIVKSSPLLSVYTKSITHDNFRWIENKLYHVSNETMTFADCNIYCASKSAEMVRTVTDTWRTDHEVNLPFQSVWLDTVTKINGTNYEVFLDDLMLYPKNRFTRRNPAPSLIFSNSYN